MSTPNFIALAALGLALGCGSAAKPASTEPVVAEPAPRPRPMTPPAPRPSADLYEPEADGALIYLKDATDTLRTKLAAYRRTPVERRPRNDIYRLCVREAVVFGAKIENQDPGSFRDALLASLAKELGARKHEETSPWQWVSYHDRLDGFELTSEDGSTEEILVLQSGAGGDIEHFVMNEAPGFLPVLSLRKRCPAWWENASDAPDEFLRELEKHNDALRPSRPAARE